MASKIWRPVDFEDDAHSKRVQEEPPKIKTRRCKVIEAEEKIVLQCYELFSTVGWEDVLENVKELVREPMSGNALKLNKIKEYYQQTSSKAALKCIQTIVSQNVQRTLQPHRQDTASTSTSQTQQMSDDIKLTKTRYSKKCDQPESRKFRKFAHAANLNSTDTSDEGLEVVDKEVTNLDPQDSSVEGNGEDKKGKQIKRKKSDHRGKLAKEASKAHVKMCGKAMKMLDKMQICLKNMIQVMTRINFALNMMY